MYEKQKAIAAAVGTAVLTAGCNSRVDSIENCVVPIAAVIVFTAMYIGRRDLNRHAKEADQYRNNEIKRGVIKESNDLTTAQVEELLRARSVKATEVQSLSTLIRMSDEENRVVKKNAKLFKPPKKGQEELGRRLTLGDLGVDTVSAASRLLDLAEQGNFDAQEAAKELQLHKRIGSTVETTKGFAEDKARRLRNRKR